MANDGALTVAEVPTPSSPLAGNDKFYMKNGSLPRFARQDSAGNEWLFEELFMHALSADYTLSDVNTAQKAFNGTANGTITLPGSSAYILEADYTLTNTGTTSHTWAVLFGGTATLTSGRIQAIALSGTSSAMASANIGHTTTPGTAFVVTAASTSATENVNILLKGVVRINAGGTFIPQVQLSAATGGTEKMLANSYFKLTPFGPNTAVSLGPWS